MTLKSLNIAPPGNWRFTCPHCPGEPKITSVGTTFYQLVQRVQQHYDNQNHDSPNLADEIEAGICASLSPHEQKEYCNTGVRPRTTVSWGEVNSFFHWLAKWLLKGAPLVEHAEAERRAAICATCPYNIFVSGCATCRTSIGVLRNKLIRPEATAQDNHLRACGVCGCDLRTIVHVPIETLRHRGLNEQFAKVPWCWQNDGKKP